jgi:hypothetical protein
VEEVTVWTILCRSHPLLFQLHNLPIRGGAGGETEKEPEAKGKLTTPDPSGCVII